MKVIVRDLHVTTFAGLQGDDSVRVSPVSLVVKLVLTVLLSTLVGMGVRAMSHKIRAWVTRHKVKLGLVSNTSLLMILWQTLSGARGQLVRQSAGSMGAVVAAAVVLHFVCLVFNAVVVVGIRLPPAEAVAVLIMASQKSAPVAVRRFLISTSPYRKLPSWFSHFASCVGGMSHVASYYHIR
jgi:solute carrier family 10 (sodium/bile acid cotransporter), member 7